MTRIHIKNLALRCVIGVFPEERRERQDVLINVTLDCDIPVAARTDRIEDTVDYKGINKDIIRLVEGSECYLVETLAEKIAEIGLADERVKSVNVQVDKPGALRFADSVAIEITRSRPGG